MTKRHRARWRGARDAAFKITQKQINKALLKPVAPSFKEWGCNKLKPLKGVMGKLYGIMIIEDERKIEKQQ